MFAGEGEAETMQAGHSGRLGGCGVVLALVCLGGGAAPAFGQEAGGVPRAPRHTVRVLLLPTVAVGRSPGGRNGPEWLGQMLQNMRPQVEEAGLSIWSGEAARAAFEQHHSTEPSSVSLEALNQWMTHAREGLRALGGADYGEARAHLQEANRFLQYAVDELNREVERAQRVLDTCLYLVRYFIEEASDVRQAARHARRCALLVPGVEPSWPMHTPEVVEVFKHEQQVLAEEPPVQLEVHSEPKGCAVRVNGIVFGKTPFLASSLAQGSYRVQVECPGVLPRGRRGRVHHMELHAGRNRLWVDAAFEAAVHTDGLLRLWYPDWTRERTQRVEHARQVAEAIGAEHVVLVTLTGDALFLDRLKMSPEPHVLASAQVVPPPTGPTFDEVTSKKLLLAFRALAAGRSVRIESDPPKEVPIEPWLPPSAQAERAAREAARSRMTTVNWLGLGAAAVGVGALGFGWAQWAGTVQSRLERFSVAYPTDIDYLDRQERYVSAKGMLPLFALLGGGVASAGLALGLPEGENGVPAWAWASGGLGAALLAWGAPGVFGSSVPLLQEAGCASTRDAMGGQSACVGEKPARQVGLLLWGSALPFLSVPATYLLRQALGSGRRSSGATVSASASADAVRIELGGRF